VDGRAVVRRRISRLTTHSATERAQDRRPTVGRGLDLRQHRRRDADPHTGTTQRDEVLVSKR